MRQEILHTKFYRYYGRYILSNSTAIESNEMLDLMITTPQLMLDTLNVVKETPKGVWVSYDKSIIPNIPIRQRCKFILHTSKTKYAYDTKEKALNAFKMKKYRQIQILSKQLDNTKLMLQLVVKTIDEESECVKVKVQ